MGVEAARASSERVEVVSAKRASPHALGPVLGGVVRACGLGRGGASPLLRVTPLSALSPYFQPRGADGSSLSGWLGLGYFTVLFLWVTSHYSKWN